MHTKDVTIDQVKKDDHFYLGGRLYKVVATPTSCGGRIRLAFNNPQFMPSYTHLLEMDPGFTMQVIRTNP